MLRTGRLALIAGTTMMFGAPTQAAATSYMFWVPPHFEGEPVHGGEPGIGLPLPDAKPAELAASLLWSLRAGLNVAALQCQFAPALATVKNYNTMLSQHAVELGAAYSTISGYFKRTGGKTWQSQFDQYTTRTYNGFSTLNAQIGFCDTAAAIGRDVLAQPRGSIHVVAENRMREFRNSLIPSADGIYAFHVAQAAPGIAPPPLDPACYDKKDRLKKQCMPAG